MTDPLADLAKMKTDKGRIAYLNRLWAKRLTDKDKAALHNRALLATAIREAGLWPK